MSIGNIYFISLFTILEKLTTFVSVDIINKEPIIYSEQEVCLLEQKKEQQEYLLLKQDVAQNILQQMPLEQELADLADFFKVFGDATRLKIMQVLLDNEMCVYDIARILNISQSAISHQLRILKQMALVKNRRDGKVIFYSLADDHITSILSQGLVHIREDH